MTEQDAKKELIFLWIEKAQDAVSSAGLELDGGHVNFAVNRLYYACFYAVTALLLTQGKEFARHSAVKAEFIKSFIKTGTLEQKWNVFYQKLFLDRHEVDYIPTARFADDEVRKILKETEEFVSVIVKLIQSQP